MGDATLRPVLRSGAPETWLLGLCVACSGCRKKKAVHKTTSTDDKRLQNTLKRLGVNTIPGIEEVNIFKDNNEVVHFVNPKGEMRSEAGQRRRDQTAFISRACAGFRPGVLTALVLSCPALQFKPLSQPTHTSSAGHHRQRVSGRQLLNAGRQ